MNKVCTWCGLTKSLDEFHWRDKGKGIRQSCCKPCRKGIDAERWRAGKKTGTSKEARDSRKAVVRDYVWACLVESGCTDCGEQNPVVLEFDHIREKSGTVSKMMADSVGLELIKQEIEKCEVVCKNCHAKRTARRGNHWKHARLVSETGITQQ